MDKKTSEQLIKEQIKSLPEAIQEAIASFDWAREVFDIGRSYDLHVDQIGGLQTEVMLVVLGLLSPQDFFNQTLAIVGGNRELAEKVTEDINIGIFLRIRKYLQSGPLAKTATDQKNMDEEKKILQKAGVSFGDEETPVSVGSTPPTKSEPAPPTASVKVAEVAAVVKQKPQMQASGVFKTKVTDISTEGKPKNFFDPYREPVE